MAKSPIERYDVWGIIFFLAILIGIFALLSSLLFNIRLLGYVGISLLIFSAVGIVVIRKRVAALKRTNPEFFKALQGEDSVTATKCAVCGREDAFLFRCYYCTKWLCEEHKLPKNHHCSMAPTASFRTVLFIGTLAIFIGIAVLYVSLMSSQSLGLLLGGFLIFFGTILLVSRAWVERQSKRAMDIDRAKFSSRK